MAYDEALAKRVKVALGTGRRVEETRMFGGVAFMVQGKMCVTVGKDRIMCRIDPAIYDNALKRPGATTVVMRGRQFHGYVRVAAEALETKRDLDYGVGLALDFNSRAKASPRKER